MYRYVRSLNSERWKKKGKTFSEDRYPQHTVGYTASSENQVAADGRRDCVNVRLLLGSVSPARAGLLVRIT